MDAVRALLTLTAAIHGVHCISVEAGLPDHKHVHGEVDPDEYLWSQLPGRCCFEIQEECPTPESPRELCKKTAPDTCRACSVWSTPENYCHTSRENCLSCGMLLYCPSPPPLLEGNKVCTGVSRIGHGCFDDMATGMCAAHTETDCENACRAHADCELFVYYPEEMKGSCVLCSDLFSFEPTPDAATRAYAVSAERAPPLPPGVAAPSAFAVIPDPFPSAPPPALLPPSISPAIKSTLGRHKAGKSTAHVDCTFVDGVEYTTTKQDGYSDKMAKTKEECCEMCGHSEEGCSNFVFEPSSGVCVLLPKISSADELETDDNQFVVSGTASVGAVATGAETFPTSDCSYMQSAGFTSGSIGVARPLPGGIMHSSEDCCRSCGVTPDCAKFAYVPGTKKCTMYASFAEVYRIDNIIAGTIQSKMAGGASFSNAGFGDGSKQEGMLTFSLVPPSPGLPSFARLVNTPPPSPLKHRESSMLDRVLRDMSVGFVGAIGMGFLLAMYCFCAPQILTLVHTATGGRVGKLHVKSHRIPRIDEDEEDYLERRRGSRRGHKGHRHSDSLQRDEYDERPVSRFARVMVQTRDITQSREIDIGHCADLEDLRNTCFEEFHALLKGLRRSQIMMFCLASSESDEEQMMWFLITKRSDFSRVIKCAAFRLQDKQGNDDPVSSYAVAFERGRRKDKDARRSREVGWGSKRSRNRSDRPLLLSYSGNDHAAQTLHDYSVRGDEHQGIWAVGGCTRQTASRAHNVDDRPGLPHAGRMERGVEDDSTSEDEDCLACGPGSHGHRYSTRQNGRWPGACSGPLPGYALAIAPPSASNRSIGSFEGGASEYQQRYKDAPSPLPPPPPPPSADSLALTTSALDLLSTRLPGCNSVPPASATRSEVSAWDDDDANGPSRMSRSRMDALADALLE